MRNGAVFPLYCLSFTFGGEQARKSVKSRTVFSYTCVRILTAVIPFFLVTVHCFIDDPFNKIVNVFSMSLYLCLCSVEIIPRIDRNVCQYGLILIHCWFADK